MKSYAVAMLALASLAAQATPPAHNGADLRRLLTQTSQGAPAPTPRQLSPDQRAELRRQLGDARPSRRN
jgi:hypothetical protein